MLDIGFNEIVSKHFFENWYAYVGLKLKQKQNEN